VRGTAQQQQTGPSARAYLDDPVCFMC